MSDFSTNSFISLGWDIALLVASVMVAKCAQLIIVKLFSSKHIFHSELTRCIIKHTTQPLLWVLIILAFSAILSFMHFSKDWLVSFQLYIRPVIVAMLGWLVIGIARGTGEWLVKYYPGKKNRDNLGIRRFNTQIHLLMRVVIIVIIALTVIGMAMVIPALRELGMSLFASAGVAGIIIGIAAKETLSNLLGGMQLALSQQILLDDEVVVDDQLGTIEEITSSYVVLRTWDLRRVVIPLRFFMENTFENWTYHEPNMFGAVDIFTDYTVDIAALRAEAERIVKQSSLWDGKRFELIITNSKENVLQIRITVSGKNSSDVWGLQCETREKVITYLQSKQPKALPKTRIELEEKKIPVRNHY